MGKLFVEEAIDTSISKALYIGWHENVPAESYFDGFIDEVRIYSEALTAYQIQQMYAEGAPKHRIAESARLLK